MKAKALICDKKQNFSIEDVILDDPKDEQIVIRTYFSGVSIGTEFALIRNKLYWGPYPLCTGYQGTGIVEKVGKKVKNANIGDKVYGWSNKNMEFHDGKKISCVSGVHCSHAVVNDGDYGKLPENVNMEVASMHVMPAVGLYGVDMANPRMDSTVVVHGSGLIGQGVIAACSHRGCLVIAVDINKKQLMLAQSMGADYIIDSSECNILDEVKRIAPKGADYVFECTGIPNLLDSAIELCRQFGTFVWQGNYGSESPVSINFMPAHLRQLTMFFPCGDGGYPCNDAVLKNMASGALKWENTITNRISYMDAPDMYTQINNGKVTDIIGVVIRWIE
jgi:2-desacetyl-2-hydroxyethyl bacteriochlorophyllide A dehydrogenase